MNIADLKHARDVGATHEWCGRLFKFNDHHELMVFNGKWGYSDVHKSNMYGCKIDFTPLNDYYADKELDIRATGEAE